ncbi:MAG: ribosomal-processing cysteine protease Prp [Spirochaetales bacterium]|nr:ribosomal-processing cysteine protease Prp [Spirochaetales bacterium]
MIKIELKRNHEYFYGLKVFGHSNFARKGKDIVCAAVSTLVQTAYALFNTCVASEIKQSDNGKCFEIEIKKVADDDYEKITNYCDFLMTGLFLVEKHYPDYVEIIILED